MTVALVTSGLIAPKIIIPAFGLTIRGELTTRTSISTCQSITIKRANQVTLQFLLTSNGAKLTNAELIAADNIIFAVKRDNKDSNLDALIYKDVLTATLDILPDAGATDPNISVTLNSNDTDIESDIYFLGVQVDFTSTFLEEADLILPDGSCLKNFIVEQDVVR